MSSIIKPLRWWDMVSPQGEQEMIPFLRAYMGKGKQFRTPKRIWEDLWRLKRGEMNHVMGMRKFGKLTNFKGPKYQAGILHPVGMWHSAASGGTEPELTDIDYSKPSGSGAQRIHVAYDSDGAIQWATGGIVGSATYADLTTQDGGSHSTEWWPDQPETNEGLNWDIQFTNVVNAMDFTFRTTVTTPADRTVDVWYLLDDVSNDHADGTLGGALVTRMAGGKTTGSATGEVDVEIGTDPTAIASHTVDITVTKV